jgi:hypothetical protein
MLILSIHIYSTLTLLLCRLHQNKCGTHARAEIRSFSKKEIKMELKLNGSPPTGAICNRATFEIIHHHKDNI